MCQPFIAISIELEHTSKCLKFQHWTKIQKEEDNTKNWKIFSVSLNRLELDNVSDLKMIDKLVLKLFMSLRVCCLIGQTFKGSQWCNNANVTSRKNIRNLSLAYPDICVGSWYEAIGKRHIQNSSKHLRWSVLPNS